MNDNTSKILDISKEENTIRASKKFLDNKNMYSTIWVDCFNEFPLTKEIYNIIQKEKKQICLVSSELQQQPEKIGKYRNYIIKNNIIPDMICTKNYNIYNWI